MLLLIQLFLTGFSFYSAFTFEEEVRLIVPLVCLVLMFLVGRVDRKNTENERARKNFLKSEIDKISQKDSTMIKEQDFFTIETLLWPKNEMLLLDAVHAIFKDLGFKVSAGVHYQSVDRIVKIPNTQNAFGLQVMMCEGEAEMSHPKINRILQFEQDKRENEKTLIIASTHTRLPLAERNDASHVSKNLTDLLIRDQISFITAHHLYSLWQKAKKDEIDIFEFFQKIYFHRSGIYPQKEIEGLFSRLPESSAQ